MRCVLSIFLVLLALCAHGEEKKSHEPMAGMPTDPMPMPMNGDRFVAPPECPTKDKPTLFDNKASTERQLRFTPIMKDGKLSKLYVQMCKGDPLSCVGYISDWKWVVQDTDLKLSKDDQVLVEQALKKDGKYLSYPDQKKDDAKRKELEAFEKVARHIISEGARLDPGTFEPKPVAKNSNEAAMLTGFFQPRPQSGAVIYPPSASDAIWLFPEDEKGFDRSAIRRKKDESNLANQLFQSMLFVSKGLTPIKAKMRDDRGADLKRLHEIRMQIAPTVAFMKATLAKHADENGRAKVRGSEFSELEWEFEDYQQPGGMLLRLDRELEQIEQVTIAQDPNQACVLEQGKPVDAPDFSKIALPEAPKNVEFSGSIAIPVDYGQSTKPLDDKDPKVREAALEYFKGNPTALKDAKALLSELYSERSKEPTFGKQEKSTSGGKKFISDDREQIYAAFPELKGKPLTFEAVRKHLMTKGDLDSIQFQLTPKNGSFYLQAEIKKGRRQAGGGGRGYEIKPGPDGKLHIPYSQIIKDLAATFGSKGYYEYDSRISSQLEAAQKKEDDALKKELDQGIDDLLKLQRELGGGTKPQGTGER